MSTVALYHCNSIEDIPQKIRAIFHGLGMEKVTSLFQNKKVLLKPNLCIDHSPERGATTHPAVLDALIAFGKQLGAEIIVGDGAAIGVKGNVFEKTGIAKVCKKHHVHLLDFNREEGRTVKLENALALEMTVIAKTYFEVDTIVNVPVLKSNMLYWVSGALKNMKGLMVGLEKHKPHYLGVPQCVADLNRMVRQDLIIMDGVIGMMGDGPTAGKPAHARLLMGSFDPVAIDTVAVECMGFPAREIPMLTCAVKSGIGSSNPECIGDPVETFDVRFEKPMIAKNRLKARLFDFASKFFFRNAHQQSHIVIDKGKCRLCGRCQEMCPFKAITIVNKSIAVDKAKCDFCLCCIEVCTYDAISLKGMLVRKDAFLR
jgi:uncharacterized protein (DUF362 family)/Pyruvate/2-oxoacid:ferredoxin oxidoreductase delta subunit